MTEVPKISLAVSLALLVAIWLASLLAGGPQSLLDIQLLNAAASPALVPAAQVLTKLGNGYVLLPLTAAAAILLAIRGERRRALLFVALVLTGRLLVEFQKFAFDRARPDPSGQLTAVHSMAFPSGHAANSMIVALGIALIAVTASRLRGPAIFLALLLSCLVGLTRLVLGVHWPSDVMGGWAFGVAWTLALVQLSGGFQRNKALATQQGAGS